MTSCPRPVPVLSKLRIGVCHLIVAVCAAFVVLPQALRAADVPATQPAPIAVVGSASPTHVSFFAWGDWGIDTPERKKVADTMADFADHAGQKPSVALLLGDNFYVNLTGVDDPRFKAFFEDTYDVHRLNVPCYAVLGNHDYKQKNVDIELGYEAAHPGTRFHLPARWYRLDLPPTKPLLTLLMLDSDHDYMPAANWADEITWLNFQLQQPRAQWTICCGHHDMFGNANHGDNGVLQKDWGTLFKQYHVDFYLCGHEHTLQHLEIPGWSTSFVVSGGGGAAHPGMLRDNRGPFSKSVAGFADFDIRPEAITVQMVDIDGAVDHAFRRDKDGAVTTLTNTPSDAATSKPLKTIQGLDTKKGGGD